MRIAIMQPYFLPYAGYFRLFAATDLFVVYDCVQFPRRGWVHRNRFLHANGELRWLTLPIRKAPQSVRIEALRFDESREQEWQDTLRKFPCFASSALAGTGLSQQVAQLEGTLVDYIEALLRRCCELLNFPFRVERSSKIGLPAEVRGQDRILAICRHFGATTYVNSPGGRELYSAETFRRHRLALGFLPPYRGDVASVAQRFSATPLSSTTLAELKDEILSQSEIVP